MWCSLLSPRFGSHPRSAEREHKSLDSRIEEFDLELAIGDGFRLPDQLIKPLLGGRAVALGVDVDSVTGARRVPVDEDRKTNGRPWGRGSHHEVEIARVKAVRDSPGSLVERDGPPLHRPVSDESPLIEPQRGGGGIDAAAPRGRAAGRREVLRALVP